MWRKACIWAVAVLELNSYCKGVCQARYQDGAYLNGKCACIDYQAVNIPQRFEVPGKRKKEFDDPKVYYGADEMHIAPADPPPTAPLDF